MQFLPTNQQYMKPTYETERAAINLTLDGGCCPTRGVHPGNRGELNPAYRESQYDEWGKAHNDGLAFYRWQNIYRNSPEESFGLVRSFFQAYPFVGKGFNQGSGHTLNQLMAQTLHNGFFDDLDTVFWPELPDLALNNRFLNLWDQMEAFDIRYHDYREFYRNIVIIENDVMLSSAPQDLKHLFGATFALMRYSTAFWVQQFVHNNPQGDGPSALCKPGRIIRADCRAFRRARREGYNDFDAQHLMTYASGSVEG